MPNLKCNNCGESISYSAKNMVTVGLLLIFIAILLALAIFYSKGLSIYLIISAGIALAGLWLVASASSKAKSLAYERACPHCGKCSWQSGSADNNQGNRSSNDNKFTKLLLLLMFVAIMGIVGFLVYEHNFSPEVRQERNIEELVTLVDEINNTNIISASAIKNTEEDVNEWQEDLNTKVDDSLYFYHSLNDKLSYKFIELSAVNKNQGKNVMLCHQLAKVVPFAKGVYLYYEDKSLFRLVIFNRQLQKMAYSSEEIKSFVGRKICAYGPIVKYGKYTQIIINHERN